jgi:membrane protein YqaA with SNARE-associated domain
MRIFSYFYDKMIIWAKHQHAPYYLYGLSFAESSFFPIPPDVMLAPMALANPSRAWIYALFTTIASVLGGVFGYLIGLLAFDLVHPIFIELGYETTFQNVETWFNAWGFWVMFVAGFAPIPYKLFTIAGGAMHIALLPFILGSFIGRGGRFFLVTAIIRWGGERLERGLREYIDRIGWILVVSVLIVYGAYIYYHHS